MKPAELKTFRPKAAVLTLMGVLALAPQMLLAQSSDENSIVIRAFTDSAAIAAVTRIVYYDGLGRESTAIDMGKGGNNGDVVTLRQYDALGRPWRDWLPATMSTSGLKPNDGAVIAASISQYADPSPYTTTEYDTYPQSQVTVTCAPGPWQSESKKKRTEHLTNTSSGILSCLSFNLVNGGNAFQQTGNVTAGSSVDSNRTAGDLVIAEGVDYEIEAKGEVRLDKGFQVEKGAMFKVIPAAW